MGGGVGDDGEERRGGRFTSSILGGRAIALVIVGVSGRPTECSLAGRAIDLDDVARAGD